MVDVALAIEYIIEQSLGVSGAQYGGSTTENTEEQYNKLRWNDVRLTKQSWQEILDAWNIRKDIPEPKTEMELMQEKIDDLDSRLIIQENK